MINLHADDYGYDTTVDDRMLLLLRAKKLTGVSVLSTMVSKTSLKKLANALSGRRSPRVALHVNLTENSKNRNGYSNKYSPLKIRGVGGVMNDRAGDVSLFRFVFRLLTRRVSQQSIEREIERQLKILTNAGIKVTVIDSHQHVHALSPVAEAVVTVARKHKIKYIRSYRDVERYTFIARVKYRILQVASLISYLTYYRRLALPVTWRIKGDSIAVMSWESPAKDQRPKTNDHITYITHPFLPFDSNTSYYRLLNIPSVIARPQPKQSLLIKIATSASRRTRDDKLKGGDTS